MKYRVSADIEYLDGTFAGMLIPAGYAVSYPTRKLAQRCSAWLAKVQRENDFIRATLTGDRYQVRGRIAIDKLA